MTPAYRYRCRGLRVPVYQPDRDAPNVLANIVLGAIVGLPAAFIVTSAVLGVWW